MLLCIAAAPFHECVIVWKVNTSKFAVHIHLGMMCIWFFSLVFGLCVVEGWVIVRNFKLMKTLGCGLGFSLFLSACGMVHLSGMQSCMADDGVGGTWLPTSENTR